MNHLIRLSFIPHTPNLALLLLRVFVGTSLFLKHGLEKVTNFSQMAHHFPDPLHVGSQLTLAFALLSDAVCSLLVIIGLGTRWAGLIIAVNTAAALTFVHGWHLSGEHNGELPWMYLASALVLFLSGAGKFSIDHGLASHGNEHREPRTPGRRRFKAAGR